MRRALIIGFGIILFLLILLFVTFLESLKNTTGEETITNKITPTTPAQRVVRDPLVDYNDTSTDKLLDIVDTRPTPLLQRDVTIRNQIVSALNNGSGVIQTTEDYRLEYVKSPNSFEAEIKTIEIDRAKEGVISYLKSRGLSEDGICKLPLMFYLNYEVAKNVDNNKEFSPIPDFCLE